MRKDIIKWAEKNYANGEKLESVFAPLTVESDGENYENAIVFGDDECFESDEFYQYMLHGDSLYMAYYDCDAAEELCDIDYAKPCRIDAIDDIDFIFD